MRVESIGQSFRIWSDNGWRLFFGVTATVVIVVTYLVLCPGLSGRSRGHSIVFYFCGIGRPGRKLFVSARSVLDLNKINKTKTKICLFIHVHIVLYYIKILILCTQYSVHFCIYRNVLYHIYVQ